jgi:hypothetical protein
MAFDILNYPNGMTKEPADTMTEKVVIGVSMSCIAVTLIE